MARFKKCAEPTQAPSAEAEAEHPGRKSFVEFIRHVRPSVKITKQIRLLAAKVEPALVRQEHWLRLILVWPPRTGKTTAGSVLLLAWIFGLYPEWEAIVGSLSGKLATKIGAKVRGIIGCDKYQDVFPGVMLSKHTNSKTEFAVINSKNEREGYFFASGRNTRANSRCAGPTSNQWKACAVPMLAYLQSEQRDEVQLALFALGELGDDDAPAGRQLDFSHEHSLWGRGAGYPLAAVDSSG